MKAVKGNKVYTIDDAQKKGYQDAGYDILSDSGNLLAYGRGKTVPFEEYEAVKKALEEAGAGDFSKEESLRHPYTKALYRAMPEHGFLTVSGSQPFVTELPRGCFYGPRCAYFSEECKGTIPYRGFQEGMVRCLKAGQFRAKGEDVHETGRKKSDVSV